MPFIQIKVVAGVFTGPQKREIVERVTEALVAIAGEGMRQLPCPGAWWRKSRAASGGPADSRSPRTTSGPSLEPGRGRHER
jgi:hypothetical protein